MSNIVESMMGAIRAQVCGREYAIDKNISAEDMARLYAISKSQDMVHIVGAELEKQGLLGVDEVSDKFRKQPLIALFRYERINYELIEICQVLENAGIAHIPLKGSVMRRYYPEPWQRTSADIDILVHESKLEQAVEVLMHELEYTSNNIVAGHDVSLYSPSGVHLELHFDTVEDKRAVNSNAILSKIWDYSDIAEGYSYRYELRDEMFYFYHVAHMAKHFEVSGCGVRFFLDMWLLNHKVDFDREKRAVLLKAGGLERFEEEARRLSEVWFSETDGTDLSRMMEEYVLNGGVYGSRGNAIALKQIKKGGRFGYIMGRIFVPYKKMKTVYPILEKHKWLLPICEVRRWCRLIFCGGMKRSVSEIKLSAGIDEGYRSDVDVMFEHFGLIRGYEHED